MKNNNKLQLSVFLTNLGKYTEGELCGKWVIVDVNTSWSDELKNIGVDGVKYEEYFITDVESNFDIQLGEYTSIVELKDLAEKLEELNDEGIDAGILSGLIELTGDFNSAYQKVMDGEYNNIPDVQDESDIGYYLVEEGYFSDVPENVKIYLDYDAIGRDYVINTTGTFTDSGYISIY